MAKIAQQEGIEGLVSGGGLLKTGERAIDEAAEAQAYLAAEMLAEAAPWSAVERFWRMRVEKNGGITPWVAGQILRSADESGWTVEEVLVVCVERGWLTASPQALAKVRKPNLVQA